MNKKLSKTMIRIMGLFCVLVVVGMMTGCSVQNWTTTKYQAPNWTPSGKIVMAKQENKYHKDPITIGDQLEQLDESKSYIVEMNADGSGEHTLFQTEGFTPMIQVSTSENYVAYIVDGLVIRTKNGDLVSNIKPGSTIYSFDWSPDESKVVVEADTPLKLYTREGNFIKNLSNGSQVSWKYNDAIALLNWDQRPPRLATRNIIDNSDFIVNTSIIGYPHYLKNIMNMYIFVDHSLSVYNLSTGVTNNLNVDLSGLSDEFIAPDGSKVVATEINNTNAIWLIDVSSNIKLKLR